LQWQIEKISNFRDENSIDLYLQGQKIYLNKKKKSIAIPISTKISFFVLTAWNSDLFDANLKIRSLHQKIYITSPKKNLKIRSELATTDYLTHILIIIFLLIKIHLSLV